MDFDLEVKLAVYETTAARGTPPPLREIAVRMGAPATDVKAAYARIASRRLLVLEPDGETIRMAPPFSGTPTQHLVLVDGVAYHANCAWDALGIPAALRRPGLVLSRCEQSLEPLRLEVGVDGPAPSTWLFHCLVPAALWWENIVFT
jgi:hypothetical protein